mgnify:CR=1 FL=1
MSCDTAPLDSITSSHTSTSFSAASTPSTCGAMNACRLPGVFPGHRAVFVAELEAGVAHLGAHLDRSGDARLDLRQDDNVTCRQNGG